MLIFIAQVTKMSLKKGCLLKFCKKNFLKIPDIPDIYVKNSKIRKFIYLTLKCNKLKCK